MKQVQNPTGKDRIAKLAEEVRQHIISLLGGNLQRTEGANWASSKLRSISSADFSATPCGLLVEYVLSRLLDDDWSDDPEFAAELKDLLSRLDGAVLGHVELP